MWWDTFGSHTMSCGWPPLCCLGGHHGFPLMTATVSSVWTQFCPLDDHHSLPWVVVPGSQSLGGHHHVPMANTVVSLGHWLPNVPDKGHPE